MYLVYTLRREEQSSQALKQVEHDFIVMVDRASWLTKVDLLSRPTTLTSHADTFNDAPVNHQTNQVVS